MIRGFSNFLFLNDSKTESESMINFLCLLLETMLRARFIAWASAVNIELFIGRAFLRIVLALSLEPSAKTYEVLSISFQTFFVWALLLIVHTWNSSPLWSNLLRLQCTCCTIPTPSGRPHGSPLVWTYQWPSLQPLSSPQLSHNDSLWT